MSKHTKLRVELEKELDGLVTRAKKIDEDLSDPGDPDWEDRATESEDDEVLASVGNVTLKEIEQIKHAIYMIDHGTYGTCAKCHAEISPKRLQVLPYATTCVACV